MRRRRDIPPPPRPEGEPEIANARLLIRTGLWLAWKELRARLSLRRDPTAIKTKSYNEMALENAAAALREEGQLDGYAYPPPPEPGVDYEEFDVPADVRQRMDARMAEVYVWSAREKGEAARRKGVRRRRLVAVGATAVLGLTGVAGASAVIGGTGIDLVDDVLSISDRGAPDADDSSEHPRGRLSGKIEAYESLLLELPLTPGRSITATAYISDAGRELCIASALSVRSRTTGTPNESTCVLTRGLDLALERQGGFILSASGQGTVLGLAASDVETIEGEGPVGKLTVELSEPWDPRYPGIEAFRLFLARGKLPGKDAPTKLGERLSYPGNYELQGRRGDGSTAAIVYPSR